MSKKEITKEDFEKIIRSKINPVWQFTTADKIAELCYKLHLEGIENIKEQNKLPEGNERITYFLVNILRNCTPEQMSTLCQALCERTEYGRQLLKNEEEINDDIVSHYADKISEYLKAKKSTTNSKNIKVEK